MSAVDDGSQRQFIAPRARREQLPCLLRRHRFSEIPALPDLAAEPDDGLVGSLVFDPFDANWDLKCSSQVVTARTIAELALGVDVGDEASIDLDDVDMAASADATATRNRCRNRRARDESPDS